MRDHFADGNAFVLDVVLLVEAILFVEFFHFAGGDFVHDGFGLAGGQRLGFIDFALFLQHFGRYFFAADIARIERGDVHGDIVRKLLEGVGAGHKVGFAIDFHQHADFSAGVNVAADQAFAGFARGFLGRRGLPLFAQDADGFFEVPIRFHERGATIREAGVGALAQLLYQLRWNIHGTFVWSGLCAHCFVSSRLVFSELLC